MANSNKAIGGIVIIFLLILIMNPLIDEVTAIAEHENATRYDAILGSTFPPLYVVMVLACCGAVVYWVWKS